MPKKKRVVAEYVAAVMKLNHAATVMGGGSVQQPPGAPGGVVDYLQTALDAEPEVRKLLAVKTGWGSGNGDLKISKGNLDDAYEKYLEAKGKYEVEQAAAGKSHAGPQPAAGAAPGGAGIEAKTRLVVPQVPGAEAIDAVVDGSIPSGQLVTLPNQAEDAWDQVEQGPGTGQTSGAVVRADQIGIQEPEGLASIYGNVKVPGMYNNDSLVGVSKMSGQARVLAIDHIGEWGVGKVMAWGRADSGEEMVKHLLDKPPKTGAKRQYFMLRADGSGYDPIDRDNAWADKAPTTKS